MKKTIIFALVLALVVPSIALAAAEFSLGGFIKLDTFWDSSQEGKNMNGFIARNNDSNFHHGRVKFTAQGSRFNLTIKGPKLFGATTTGFIEMDFDSGEAGPNAAGAHAGGLNETASHSYTPRLRHAMFRFNWPETELLMGQYWSMMCEWWPETAQDGPFQATGIPTARLAQIRVTQKFAGAFTVAALIGEGSNNAGARTFSANDTSGESGEMPQIQGKIAYEQDLWGKAAYYGKPTPFTVQLAAAMQRSDFNQRQAAPAVNIVVTPFGEQNFGAAVAGARVNNRYLYPWIAMGSMFVPVIPTHSANLAGTAAFQTQWWIGTGVEAFGFAGLASNFFHFSGDNNGVTSFWDQELGKRFGGYAQLQYYFTNQWFINTAYAMSRSFGVSPGETDSNAPGNQRVYAISGADAPSYQHEFDLTLWYRPIQAIKFGIQYAYIRSNWLQNRTGAVVDGVPVGPTSKFGDAHRVEFVGFFYF
jgi:hypothetical protein